MAKDLPPPELPQGPTPRTLMTKIGAWELGNTLGRGAYAHVRRAIHETGYESACKILPSLHGIHPRKVTRDELIDAVEAHKELVMLKGLAGAGLPGIVGLEGVIPYQGWNFIFLTMYPHSAATIAKHPQAIIPFFRRLLISIHGLHMLDISHEDLKRSNVLATQGLEPILVDFGFAHFTPEGGQVRSLGGTMDYSSPEKLSDKLYIPFSNDVWSLGILLLKFLGYPNPYRIKGDETEDDFKRKLIDTEADWSFLGHHGRPGKIGEVVRGMLRRDPTKRWGIPRILAHPSLQCDIPDPAPFHIPDLTLPPGTEITEDIILDVGFLMYNLHQFQLCESLELVEWYIFNDEPNWQKRWAGMLARWKQRGETLWEDVPVKTPHAKSYRGSRLSDVDVGKLSRASLRPLREIHLHNQRTQPLAITHRPPKAPTTPPKDEPRRPTRAVPPRLGVKARRPNAGQIRDGSASTPVKHATKAVPPALRPRATAPVQSPRRTRKVEPVFKAASPKVQVRTRSRMKPMAVESLLNQESTADARGANTEINLIDLSDDPVPVMASSSTTIVSTRPGHKYKHAAKESQSHKGNPKKPRTGKDRETRDKENVPPVGEPEPMRESVQK